MSQSIHKKQVSAEFAASLKTVVIATKNGDQKSYHPSYRSLAVIVCDADDRAPVQTLPTFLISETGPLSSGVDKTLKSRSDLYFQVDTFDSAVTVFAEPLAG